MITAIIMASGFSNRMGQNKLLMKYNDKPLIGYTLETISKCEFNEKILVTQYDELRVLGQKLDYKVIINENPNRGQSESIKLGIINSIENKGYMFFVGDQPLMKKDDIQKLIDIFKEDTNYIVIPKFKDKSGSPVIYPTTYKEQFLKLEGDKGGKSIIKSSSKIKYVNVDKNTLFDIDDTNDFNKLVNERQNYE